jgi:hypothetical protein
MHKSKSKAIPLFFNRIYLRGNHSHLKKIPIPFILCFLLSICKIYSQNTDLPFKAAISVGPSFPVGEFSKIATDTNSFSSDSKPGPLVSASFSYKFRHSFFGVSILGGWQQKNVDNSAFARFLASVMPAGSEIGVKSDNWHIWKILAGPTFEIPLVKNGKASFECAVLGGLLKTSIPGYEIGTTYGNPPTTTFESVSKIPLAATFCYQVDAGMNYRITPSLLLTANLGFMHAKPMHSFTIYLDPPYYQMPVYLNESYPISTINLLVGVAYLF